MPTVEGFLFDDENEDKIAAHGVSPEQVASLLDNPHDIFPNRSIEEALI